MTSKNSSDEVHEPILRKTLKPISDEKIISKSPTQRNQGAELNEKICTPKKSVVHKKKSVESSPRKEKVKKGKNNNNKDSSVTETGIPIQQKNRQKSKAKVIKSTTKQISANLQEDSSDSIVASESEEFADFHEFDNKMVESAENSSSDDFAQNVSQDDLHDFVMESEGDTQNEFTVIQADQISPLIENEIKKVTELIELPPHQSALVLQYFRWNFDKLQEEYFDNPEKCVLRAGVVLKPVKVKKLARGAMVDCMICLESVKYKNTYSLSCGHRFYCKICWRSYLTSQYENFGASIIDTKCMNHKCKVRLSREDIQTLARKSIQKKYNYFFMKSFLEQNKKFALCPNPKCSNAIRNNNYVKSMTSVKCSCGTKFCFSCGKDSHNPVTCAVVDDWIAKNQSDEESEKFVRLIAKPCFHCKRMTERAEGCNHMICRKDQGGCGHHWCWMCGGDWSTHGESTGGFYSCNKYTQSDQYKIDQQNKLIKEDLARFQWHFSRYFEHGIKEKDAVNNCEKIKDLQMKYQAETNHNPDFLMEAQEVLIKCRHSLKYTYIFGYFLPQNHKFRPLFEDQQTKLEAVTEKLADLIFKPVSKIDPQNVKTQTRISYKFMTNLVESFEEYATE